MPIRPEQRWFYPIDWHQLSAMIRFQRAKGRCERCGRPHGRDVVHLGDGRWFDEERDQWRSDSGRRARALSSARISKPYQLSFEDLAAPKMPLPTMRVVLASAHLDHDPSNNDPGNLAALCQRCIWRTIARNIAGSDGGHFFGAAQWAISSSASTASVGGTRDRGHHHR